MRPSLPVILPPSFLTFRQLPLPVISTKRQRAEKSQSPMSSLPRLFDFTLTVISTERSEWRNLKVRCPLFSVISTHPFLPPFRLPSFLSFRLKHAYGARNGEISKSDVLSSPSFRPYFFPFFRLPYLLSFRLKRNEWRNLKPRLQHGII